MGGTVHTYKHGDLDMWKQCTTTTDNMSNLTIKILMIQTGCQNYAAGHVEQICALVVSIF